jgi:hypothetical protein
MPPACAWLEGRMIPPCLCIRRRCESGGREHLRARLAGHPMPKPEAQGGEIATGTGSAGIGFMRGTLDQAPVDYRQKEPGLSGRVSSMDVQA